MLGMKHYLPTLQEKLAQDEELKCPDQLLKKISKNERLNPSPEKAKSNKYLKMLKADSNMQSMKILEKYDR